MRAILLGCALLAAPAGAASILIDPVRVDLTDDRKIAALTVANADPEAPVSIRVHALRWTQVDGEDVYSETHDIIASPPIFTIPPGGTQLLRVGLAGGADAGAYRLIIEEIPRLAAQGQGIQVSLRLNLPLYRLHAGSAPARLDWRLAAAPDGTPAIEAVNDGGQPIQVQGIDALTADNRAPIVSAMGVVLPNSRRRWRIDDGAALPNPTLAGGQPMRLIARTDHGEQEFQIAQKPR